MVTMTKATKVANATKVTVVTKIYNLTSLYDPIASGAIVDPTSQVSSSAILSLAMDRQT
jgi:hypothetical protein